MKERVVEYGNAAASSPLRNNKSPLRTSTRHGKKNTKNNNKNKIQLVIIITIKEERKRRRRRRRRRRRNEIKTKRNAARREATNRTKQMKQTKTLQERRRKTLKKIVKSNKMNNKYRADWCHESVRFQMWTRSKWRPEIVAIHSALI